MLPVQRFGFFTDEVVFLQKILGLCRRAIQDYAMISPGDSVAVGLSGGKDSVALLCALARLRSVLGGFSVTAITLDPRFGGVDTDYSSLAALCESLSVPWYFEKTDIGEIVFETRKEKNPCSLCAKMRRGALCRAAVDCGCGKLALGHHMDDALETFVMNLQNGRLACFSPVTHLDDCGVTVIRPLLYAPEHIVAKAVRKAGLPVVKSTCPKDGASRRQQVKEFLLGQEKADPGLKERMLGAMQKAHLSGW